MIVLKKGSGCAERKLKNQKLTQFFLEMDMMSIIWRECEHEELDRVVFDNYEEKKGLCVANMYTFFLFGSMRAQRILLNILIY
jgi:hypothetical protein